MGHVVDEVHPQGFPRLPEDLGEDLASLPHEQLPVAPGEVGRGPHRAEILLALVAMDRGAGQLPVGQFDAVLGGHFAEIGQRIIANLVAQAARAAMDHHADLVQLQAHRAGGRFVADFRHDLHFQEMVARAERAALVARRAPMPAS